jgi:hypothetical protein
MNKMFKPASAEELAARGIFPPAPVETEQPVEPVVAKVVKPKKASTKGDVL